MSFEKKNIWMPRDKAFSTSGEMVYDSSSRVVPKRAHQWFTDASEPELFSNKKQAIEAVTSKPMSGISNANVSFWGNTPTFQSASGHFTDRLFGSEVLSTSNLAGTNTPSTTTGNLNLESNGFDDQFGNNSSVGLSMSHAMEDPTLCLNYGGIRKVKVNQVTDSENKVSASLGHSYRGNNNTISLGATYNNSVNNISLAPSYTNGVESTISMGPNFNKTDETFISTGHTFNKGDGTFTLMGHNYSKVENNILSMGRPFDSGDGIFFPVNQQYEKDDGNTISSAPAYNKGNDNFISIGSVNSKANENFISVGPSYDKEDQDIISVGSNHEKANTSFVSTNTACDKDDSGILLMGQNYNKGERSTISFGGFQDETDTNPYGRIINGYDVLMSHPSGQTSNAPVLEDSVERIADPIVRVAPEATLKTDTVPKKKEQKVPKKVAPNNFPSNVKSLLSTGMLDGVPVKYVSWSREKNLLGIIKGTGYLCDCSNCKLSKALNAYEFERHAGCKTKHPNNHIYFENGKTVYSVVQELKTTPQEMLFETIQNVTGSPIHQKNFINWKASYEAATRELQRIYGKNGMPPVI